MKLLEEFSVCLSIYNIYNEALSGVMVFKYKPFYSRERKNCQIEGNKIVREQGNN